MKEQELGRERLLKNFPSAAKKEINAEFTAAVNSAFSWRRRNLFPQMWERLSFFTIDFITWARRPPAQATWQSAQQPNLKDSICNLCIPTVPGEGFPSDDRRLFICDLPSSPHSTGWLCGFLPSRWGQPPRASLELGVGSWFRALSDPVYPNQSHLGWFQKGKRSQLAIGPGKKSSVCKLIAFHLQKSCGLSVSLSRSSKLR